MTQEKLNKLMNSLLLISTMAILVGALIKLQHYPYGNLIFWLGIWTNFVFSSYEINRLKKIIAKSNGIPSQEEVSS
ncbi:MAG: GldL-related protein [Bacteroidales bacterium]